MQIILNPEESEAYQAQKVREAILAETSKFPANMKLPDGRKLRPRPLTKEEKALIIELHISGMERAQIAREIGLPGRQVSGVVQAYINAKKDVYVTPSPVIDYIEARQTPKIEGLQPMRPLVMPAQESPAIEPTCSSCGKPLSRDKVAIDGKMYCGPTCAPKKVPVMVTKRMRPTKSNSMIDSLMVDMAGKPPIEIADAINRRFGGTWLPDDVAKRLAELRT